MVQKIYYLKNMVFRHLPVMHRDFLCFAHRCTFPLGVTGLPGGTGADIYGIVQISK
jgi:hypothetical protein